MSHYDSLRMQIHELPLDGGEMFMATSAMANSMASVAVFLLWPTLLIENQKERESEKTKPSLYYH